MEVRLLGPVGLWHEGREVTLARSHRRCLLAALAISPGQPVPVETLVDRIWGDQPPRQALHSLYTHVSALRRALAAADGTGRTRLRHDSGSYRLELEPDLVDLHLARRYARDARNLPGGDDDPSALGLLQQASALWRGVPLGGLNGTWALAMRVGLEQERTAVAIQRFTVELRAGRHAEVLATLASLVAEQPFVEPLVEVQMLALYRSGNQTDALRVYGETRRRFVDELGDEPGERLRRLHEQMLRRDPALDLPPRQPSRGGDPATRAQPRTRTLPAQLPADMTGFVGRTEVLKTFDELLPAMDRNPPAPAAIMAIGGTAGVGKTTLAIHWAHLARHRFPDGQLFVDLRGYAPDRPLQPIEVLGGFLRALGMPGGEIPSEVGEAAALYRSLLADRRVLVVLDNARDADQVRPLLPGASGCMALVTSRQRLSGLAAAEGGTVVSLDVFSEEEAQRLLERRVGSDRVNLERDAAREIIARCGRLPLALAVVAARVNSLPGRSLRRVAGELRNAHPGIDPVSGNDSRTDVRAVLSWSYQALSPAAACVLRLLGRYAGPDIAVAAVASVAGLDLDRARQLLAELTSAYLLIETEAGRFTLHDLLRAYAAELADRWDDPATLHDAQHRLLDHYLHTAHAAALSLDPQRAPLTLVPPRPAAITEQSDPGGQPLAWFATERAVVLAMIRGAAEAGFSAHAWQLSWTLLSFVDRSGHWRDYVDALSVAAPTVDASGDARGSAHIHRALGWSLARVGAYDIASEHLRRSLNVYEKLADLLGQAHSRHSLAMIDQQRQRPADALHHARLALGLFQDASNQVGQARTLATIGGLHAELAEPAPALHYCQQALSLQQQLGDQLGEAHAWNHLGRAHYGAGDYEQAVHCHRHACAAYEQLGDRFNEADALAWLADAHSAGGDGEAAARCRRKAIEILDSMAHPMADELRGRLSGDGARADGSTRFAA